MWMGNDKKADRRPDDENFTFLARGASFKGIAHFDGTIRLDGRFEGELHAKGNLIIGDQAVVKGVVTATTVILGGKLNGTITGSERVQILKSAVMIGDLRTPALSMEEGAHFHGHSEMGADRWIEDEVSGAEPPENVHDLVAHREKLRVQELPS
jgi:cytoskeletal protein CcmA (bactofilin family)